MTYTYAKGKSDRDLASYRSVRGADLKAIASGIQAQTPIRQLHQNYVRPDDDPKTGVVDDTIDFLHSIDIIEKVTEKTVEPIQGQPFEDYQFELRVLHHLQQQEGTQDHFMKIHDLVVDQNKRLYDKEELEEDLERELDDYPFDWNVDKVEIWYNITAPLGLISVRDNQEILTSPKPVVIYELLSRFEEAKNSSNIREAFDWIEEHFFDCYTSRGGYPRVHDGLSDTIGTLLYDGVLELQAPSDATREVEIPATNASRVSRFELTDRPDKPSYWFPLEMHAEVMA